MQRISPFWPAPQCFTSPFFHPDVFIASSPNPFSSKSSRPNCLSSIKPHQVKTEQTFSTFDLHLCQEWPFQTFYFSPLANISSSCWSDTPPAVGAWFSCRALWVRIQPNFPSTWCHFTLAAWAVRGKGKRKKTTTQLAKTELRNANWLRWNPSGGRRKVSPHIFDQSGQIEGWRRGGSDWDWKSSKSALCRSNL